MSKDWSPNDSSLIYAWNAFCRVFISVLRYLSSFAAVDVSLTHLYWYGQAFAAFNPYVTEANSLKNLHRFDIYWWFLIFTRFVCTFVCELLLTLYLSHAQGNYVFVQYIFGFDIKPNLASWSTLKVIFEVLLPRFYCLFWLPVRSYN